MRLVRSWLVVDGVCRLVGKPSRPPPYVFPNGNSASQNARAVRPELIDDQLYASTVRDGPEFGSDRLR